MLPLRFRDRVTLRPREVAQITGLSVKTVHDLLNKGALRRIKIRESVLIPVADVELLLSGKGENAGAEPLTRRGVVAVRSLRGKLGIA